MTEGVGGGGGVEGPQVTRVIRVQVRGSGSVTDRGVTAGQKGVYSRGVTGGRE